MIEGPTKANKGHNSLNVAVEAKSLQDTIGPNEFLRYADVTALIRSETPRSVGCGRC